MPGSSCAPSKAPDNAAFRKLLTDLLQSALTQAKYQKNIEIDLVFRLALLKFLTLEIGNQFANLILEGKEWIRQRGEHFERSQQAHVIKSRLSELQSARRGVVRGGGPAGGPDRGGRRRECDCQGAAGAVRRRLCARSTTC